MIINVRGTSGSGKSTVVRKIMQLAPARDTMYLKGAIRIEKRDPPEYTRRLPLLYRLKWSNGMIVTVPGHYETACGGCDTIPTYDMLFDLIRREHSAGHHVLFEGLLVAHDKKRCGELWNWLSRDWNLFQIVELKDPLALCLDSVEKRREAAYAGAMEQYRARLARRKPTSKAKLPDEPLNPPFNPDNTVRRYGEVVRSCEQLAELGIPVHRTLRDDAPQVIQQLLHIPTLVSA